MIERFCLKQMLTFEEGYKLKVYPDQFGYKTVGIGTNIEANNPVDIIGRSLRMGDKITSYECDKLFQYCFTKTCKQIKQHIYFFNDLDYIRAAAIINLSYQLGIYGLLEFKRFLKCMEQKDWDGAVVELRDSKYAHQTPERCERVAQLVMGNIPEEYK